MKTIFKKPRVIITALVLVALIALAAVVVAVAADDKATFKGVQVATNGDINLRFYYDVDADVVEADVLITDGDGGSTKVTIPAKNNANGTYFQVPLASGQMGCDVTVTPKDTEGNAACAAQTWSVAEYGKAVLALDSETYAADQAKLKAILNFGHYASEYFAVGAHGNVANTVVENEGIYGMGTNPVAAWGYVLGEGNGPVATVQPGFESEYEAVGVDISFADTVKITITYKQNGETKYQVVDKLNTKQYADDLSEQLAVKTESGETAISVADATVISALKGMFSHEERRNLAAAAYGYYLWTAEQNNDPQTCAHVSHMEAVDANSSQAVCSLCGTVLSSPVSNDVNYYSAPGMLLNRYNATVSGDSKTMLTDIVNDAVNGIYTNVDLLSYGQFYITNATNRITAHSERDANATTPREIAIVDNLNGGVGKYAVLKIAFSKNATWNLKIDTNTGKTVKIGKWMIPNKSGWAGMVDNKSTEFGVIVVDLEALGVMDSDATQVSVMLQLATTASEKGDYVKVGYFAICDNFEEIASVVNNDSERLHYTKWVNDDEKALNVSGSCYSGCTTRAAEENIVYAGGENADVCYTYDLVTYKCNVPSCANYTVEASRVASTKAHDINQVATGVVLGATEHGNCWSSSSTDTCTRGDCGYTSTGVTGGDHVLGVPVMTTVGENKVYTYTCTTEGCTHITEKTVPATVNYYSAPGQCINNWGAGSSADAAANDKHVALTDIRTEDNILFTRIHNRSSFSFYVANGTATGHVTDSSVIDKLSGGMGKYMIITVRSATGVNAGLQLATNTGKTLSGSKWFRPTWLTIIVDISALTDADAETLKVRLQPANGTAYLDVASFAIVNTMDELEQFTYSGVEIQYSGTAWTNGSGHEYNFASWSDFKNSSYYSAE